MTPITFPAPLDDLPALCRQLEAEGLRLVRLEPEPSGRGLVAVTREIDNAETETSHTGQPPA